MERNVVSNKEIHRGIFFIQFLLVCDDNGFQLAVLFWRILKAEEEISALGGCIGRSILTYQSTKEENEYRARIFQETTIVNNQDDQVKEENDVKQEI